MKVETIQSNVVYHGRVFDVHQEEIRLPSGRITHLDIVNHKGAVIILPVDFTDHIWFIRQYRHAIKQEILELPAGTLEEDENPENCALREIREEIGMSAGQIKRIGGFFMAPGYTTEYLYAYLATQLAPAPLSADDDELIEIEKIPAQQAYAMAEEGKIYDSKTLATLLIAKPHLKID